MAVLNPQHLLDQANVLVQPISGRKPRQVNLRRAISSAYYAVFHHLTTAASDEFIGKSLRTDPRYTLAYRSIDHSTVRRICDEAARAEPSPRYKRHLANERFESGIQGFANNLLDLQSKRHDADYNPHLTLTSVDAMFAIYLAESAISFYNSASMEGRKTFLTLLAFPPR